MKLKDSKKMKLISEMMDKLAAVQKCYEKKCKFESDAFKNATEGHNKKIKMLGEKLMLGEISDKKYTSETKKIRLVMFNLEESKKQTVCQLEKCKREFLEFLELMTDVITKKCKNEKSPKVCEVSKEFVRFKKLLKADKLTQENIQKIFTVIMNGPPS